MQRWLWEKKASAEVFFLASQHPPKPGQNRTPTQDTLPRFKSKDVTPLTSVRLIFDQIHGGLYLLSNVTDCVVKGIVLLEAMDEKDS